MRTILLALGVWTITGTPVLSAVPGPGCAPILKAMTKTMQTDHLATTQDGSHTSAGMIQAGGVNYLQINGAWKVSPMSAQDNQKRSDENLRSAKSYTCQALPDSLIDGISVANYRTRTENENVVIDSIVSIAKNTGLAVRVENGIDTGGGTKMHYITQYSYSGIHAPTVQK